MSQSSGDHFQINIGGRVGGDVQVGRNNQIIKTAPAVSPAELGAYRDEIDALKAEIAAAATVPVEEKVAAQSQLEDLHAAATSPTPDLDTMHRVRNWFANHLPGFAGVVTGLVVHPVVGAIVKSAGESVVSEFRRRFGSAEAKIEAAE
jgi:hypothetical protein